MEYTRLGNTGLLVSRIAFGNMVNYAPEDEETNIEIIKTLYEAGVNFFDSAEAQINLIFRYQNGKCEEQLGRSIKKLNLSREKLVITIKVGSDEQEGGNQMNRVVTLNRKHILECVNASLRRMQLDYADIVFAHFFDHETPIEEICKGFNDIIEQGKAFYWATSNWTAASIQNANNYCEQNNLIKPIADQCIYNMLNREQVEKDLVNLFDQQNFGTTIWSPLQGGLLTGKYNKQVPEGSRAASNEFFKQFFFTNHNTMNKLRQLGELAQSIGYSQTQLSIAWVLSNSNVSTAILGARTVEQVKESLKALELYKKWDKNLEENIENILKNKPKQEMDFRKYSPFPDRRI